MPPRFARALLFCGAALSALCAQDAPPAGATPTTDTDPPSLSAPAIELNRQLPSWLRLGGQFRDRVELTSGIGFKPQSDHHDLTQLRIRLTIQPVAWLKFVGETQDSRIFFNSRLPDTPPYQNTFDIRQAYLQLGNPSHGWFDLVAGRQNLTFGDERLIGPSDWLNQGRTFDVARLNLHHRWFGLSLFASSVIIARDGVIDHHLQGNNLHGAYGSMKFRHTTVEPYVLWRVAPGAIRLNENAGRGALSEITFGARAQGSLGSLLEYNLEMVKQTGSLGPDSISSWAGHWNIARTLNLPLHPRPFLEANYASGTKDPTSRNWSTFDQLYPSSHDKLGFADQVGWRNIQQFRTGSSQLLTRNLRLTATYEDFWLASTRDALYSSGGAPLFQSLSGTAGRHVGQEVDAWATYTWRKIAEFGLGYGRFLTGTFLNRLTPGKDFNYPFVYLTYHFTQEPTK